LTRPGKGDPASSRDEPVEHQQDDIAGMAVSHPAERPAQVLPGLPWPAATPGARRTPV